MECHVGVKLEAKPNNDRDELRSTARRCRYRDGVRNCMCNRNVGLGQVFIDVSSPIAFGVGRGRTPDVQMLW